MGVHRYKICSARCVVQPEDFDEASTLLICNFPPGCHPFTARNYITWWGPVIRIERAPSVSQEANFVVVFAAPDFAEVSEAGR